MRRLRKFIHGGGIIIFSILIISLSSCATTRQSKLETQRQGFLLLNKSEYSMNKGRFKDRKTPRALKKTRRKMKKGWR